MPRQKSCRGMCKILAQMGHKYLDYSIIQSLVLIINSFINCCCPGALYCCQCDRQASLMEWSGDEAVASAVCALCCLLCSQLTRIPFVDPHCLGSPEIDGHSAIWCSHLWRLFTNYLQIYKAMVQCRATVSHCGLCKIVVSPLLTHCRFYSLALGHQL